MRIRNLVDAQQSALSFLTYQLTIIEPTVARVQYPTIQYPRLIPTATLGNEWARSVTYFSSDQVGRAEWFANQARDVPLAEVLREKAERIVELAAIGFQYNIEELAQAQMLPGPLGNLQADKAAAAKRAYEEFVDNVALRGDTTKAWDGLINYTSITPTFVPADGTAASRLWSAKTVDLVIRDLLLGLNDIYNTSLQIEMANTLLLPPAAITELASKFFNPSSGNALTALQWLMQYNTYTVTTGQPLTIMGVRGLETAGATGTRRMIVYRNDPEVLRMHIPMTHRFLPPMQKGPLVFEVPGIFRLGGVEIRRPGAVRYYDGF